MTSMKDKTVMITGASSGLGAHFAGVLADEGAKLVLGARREEKLAKVVDQICQRGGEAVAVSMDVTNPDSVEAAFDEAEQKVGLVNVLINNAGIADTNRFLNVEEESWRSVLETNLTGVWRVSKSFASRLVEKGAPGSIVNMSSMLGLRVSIGQSSYATSKAGVVQLTKSLSIELLKHNIRVNALCPGYFESEMTSGHLSTPKGREYILRTPAKRLGNLHELNGPILLLCSDSGSFVNGVALPVDGGHLNSSL